MQKSKLRGEHTRVRGQRAGSGAVMACGVRHTRCTQCTSDTRQAQTRRVPRAFGEGIRLVEAGVYGRWRLQVVPRSMPMTVSTCGGQRRPERSEQMPARNRDTHASSRGSEGGDSEVLTYLLLGLLLSSAEREQQREDEKALHLPATSTSQQLRSAPRRANGAHGGRPVASPPLTGLERRRPPRQ